MNFLKQNKMAIGGVVVVLLLGYIYLAYFSGSSVPALTSTDTANTALSQNLLLTLQNLQTIKLDNSIFSDPEFLSLTDFGVTIPPQTVGNSDPFLPSGSKSAGATSNSNMLPAIKLPTGGN
jgi:hypothetical protein